MGLSTEDLRFFKINGYLIKRRVMDPVLMARARQRLWDDPPPSLRPDEPRSWVGPLPESDQSENFENHRNDYRWHYRSIGSEPWMVSMLATCPAIFAIAEQLLGAGELQTPERIRGIYCTLPFGDRPRPPVACHCDDHAFHLGVVGYIDEVPPDGGGLCVWPGSHRRFYHTFQTGYQNSTAEGSEQVHSEVNREAPVDCHGKPGDILFWHHRLGHMAGHNYSDTIRKAVLCDYKKCDLEAVQDMPPCADMWQHWSAELRGLAL